MIWRADADQYVNYVNRRWLEYTGREMQQEKGWGWMETIHPEDVEEFERLYNQAYKNKTIQVSVQDKGCQRGIPVV